MLVQVEKRLWTVDEYHTMAETGILHEDDRVELIEGEIIRMSPIGVRHAACVNMLTSLFALRFTEKAVLSVQNSVRLNDLSEPQPDIVLLAYREDFYASQAPRAADVLLLIEVADSTVPYDRSVKRPLYAGAGIPDYWLINLVDNTIEVHRQPEGEAYQQITTRYRADTLAPLAFPNESFAVRDLIPWPENAR